MDAASRLAAQLGPGRLSCRGARHYMQDIAIFNTKAERRPAVTVRVRSTAEVVLAVQLAADLHLPVTVRNGGHNPSGSAVNEGGMVIVTQGLNSIKVQKDNEVVVVGAGQTWGKVYAQTELHGLIPVGGGGLGVGVAGLAVVGGIGWLSREKGLVVDNVLEMEVVLPNATVVRASKDSHPDLFWAMRGAGDSNFGVVTELSMRLHRVQPIFVAGTQDIAVVDLWSPAAIHATNLLLQAVHSIQDNRATIATMMSPQGMEKLKIFCYVFFHGPPAEAVEVLQPLEDVVRRLRPSIAQAQRVRWPVVRSVGQFVATFKVPAQMKLGWRSEFVRRAQGGGLDPSVAAAIIAGTRYAATVIKEQKKKGVEVRAQLQIEQLGGAIADLGLPPSATAFPQRNREAAFLASIQCLDPTSVRPMAPMLRGQHSRSFAADGVLAQMVQQWSRELSDWSVGSYVGYADGNTTDYHEVYYGAETYRKLQEVKDKYAPGPMFSQQENRVAPGHPRGWERKEEGSSSGAAPAEVLPPDEFVMAASSACPRWPRRAGGHGDDGAWRDLSGRTALITGGTSGLGYEAALRLGLLGARVLVAGSREGKCEAAARELTARLRRAGAPVGSGAEAVACLAMDLSSSDAVRAAVDRLPGALDILVLGAAAVAHGPVGSFGAAEMKRSVAVGLLGHQELVLGLHAAGLLAPAARIVLLSSGAAMPSIRSRGSDELVDQVLRGELPGDPSASAELLSASEIKVYQATKALVLLLGVELDRRTRSGLLPLGASVTVAIPQAMVRTATSERMLRHPPWAAEVYKMGNRDAGPWEGAMGQVFLAASTLVEGVSGRVFTGCQGSPMRELPLATNHAFTCEVFERGLELLGRPRTPGLDCSTLSS